VAFPRVLEEGGHQGGGDGLPADGLAFLAQQDQALLGVEVGRAQRQRAAAAAGGLGVQAQQQRVQLRVIAGGRRRVVDLGQARAGDGPPGRGQAARLVHFPGGVVGRVDQAVFLGVLVQAAQGGDEVLGGAAPAAGVPPGHDAGPDVLDELADLRRRGLVDAAVAPLVGDPVPVRPVCPAAAVADQGRHHRDVLGEGRGGRPCRRRGEQVGGGQAHPLQHEHGRVDHGLPGCAWACVGSGDRHRSPPSRAGNAMSAARA
jgi:hypothetical protein